MQLNTPSDQRQRNNYQRLFIKFTSSLSVFVFLVTVVGDGIWLLLSVFFVCLFLFVFFFVRLFFLFIWKVRKAYMSSLFFLEH